MKQDRIDEILETDLGKEIADFVNDWEAILRTIRGADTNLIQNWGSKYLKVVAESGDARWVVGFINHATGDVLKAASFNAPAKGARGHVSEGANRVLNVATGNVHTLWDVRRRGSNVPGVASSMVAPTPTTQAVTSDTDG